MPFIGRRQSTYASTRRLCDARIKRGISAPDEARPLFIPELNHPRRIEGVVRAMTQRKYSSDVIEKVIGGNFHRVFKEIWTL